MNIQSLILLIFILGVFCTVLFRYIRRQRRHPGCGSCNCGCDSCDACPRE